jgi:hypothetical protein
VIPGAAIRFDPYVSSSTFSIIFQNKKWNANPSLILEQQWLKYRAR